MRRYLAAQGDDADARLAAIRDTEAYARWCTSGLLPDAAALAWAGGFEEGLLAFWLRAAPGRRDRLLAHVPAHLLWAPGITDTGRLLAAAVALAEEPPLS